MKKLLILHARETQLAINDYNAIMQFGGLAPKDIRQCEMNFEDFDNLDMRDFAGIIVGGGPYDVSKPEVNKSERQKYIESTLKKHLNKIYENDIPYLGLCYGLGILVDALGGKVSPGFKEDVGPIELHLTEAGQNDRLFASSEGAQAIVGHHEGVETLPEVAVLLASSDTCPVEAIRVKNNIYATQFHPELDVYNLSQRLDAYKHHGYFSPEEIDDILNIAKAADLSRANNIIHKFCQIL